MRTESNAGNIVKPVLFLLAGLIMVGVAWWLTRPDPVKEKTQRQRQEFFVLTGSQLLNQEEQRNREAVERARRQIEANFARYRTGVPQFAESLTTWGTRYEMTKAALSDWWSKTNEARDVATNQFANFVVSDKKLRDDITLVIAQFSSDLVANRNGMLSELGEKISAAALPCASADLGSANPSAAFLLEAQPLIKNKAVMSPLIGVLAMSGGFFATEVVVARIVPKLLVAMATRLATGAAARGSLVAASALAAGGTGTAVGPMGTAIGVGVGLLAGILIESWIDKRYEAKVTNELNQMLTDMEESLWNDPNQGLASSFAQAVKTTRDCHETVLRKIITGDEK